MTPLDTVPRVVPRSVLADLLEEIGVDRNDVHRVHIDSHGITVEMWATNEHGARYMVCGEPAKHVVSVPFETAPPLLSLH